MQNSEPGIDEIGKFLTLFNKESERGAVLLAAAIIDEWLGKILNAFLIDDKVSKELLYGFNAPFGTFSARLKAAYSLGLIEKEEFEEINIIRKIRNEFGHKWNELTFESQIISDECKKLRWYGPNERDLNVKNRIIFNLVVTFILADLMWRKRLVLKEKRESKEWPHKTKKALGINSNK